MKKLFAGTALVSIGIMSLFTALGCGGGGGGSSADRNIVFITSVTGTGNLGTWADAGGQSGLAAADAVCQARADAAGLAGTFVAWLSDSSNDAYCRVHGLGGTVAGNCGQASLPSDAGPWVRTDGFPFTGTIDQLTADVIYAPVRYDEFGSPLPANSTYFTATASDGTLDAGGACSDWTSAESVFVELGIAEATGDRWTEGSSTLCTATRNILCMEAGAGDALPSFTSEGKVVFLSSASGTGDLGSWPEAGGFTGLDAGDAICRNLADAAGYADTINFIAWLSDNAANAGSELTSGGPWVRPDGVKVADDLADLLDGELFTSINVTETMEYSNFSRVYTGTITDGSAAAGNCGEWVNGTVGTAMVGEAHRADTHWTTDSQLRSCSITNQRLYCFEN